MHIFHDALAFADRQGGGKTDDYGTRGVVIIIEQSTDVLFCMFCKCVSV
jgi:hypothetical protein